MGQNAAAYENVAQLLQEDPTQTVEQKLAE
jgi:hypothetical protein